MVSTDTPDNCDGNLNRKSPKTPPKDGWTDHAENPFNWPEKAKWRIVLAACFVTLIVGLNATAIATPSPHITKNFRVSDDAFPHSVWPVTVWTAAAALGPMIGLPLLENFGIRAGYLVKKTSISGVISGS